MTKRDSAADRPWFETFFDGLALDVWRRAVAPAETAAQARTIARWLDIRRDDRVLDVPCGNGRLSIPLARKGYRLTGIDLSAEFLDEARAASDAAGLSVDWRLGDMREIPPDPPFEGAFSFGNSFGYLDHGGTDAFAAAVAGALRPGCRFVLDTAMSAESVLPNLAERLWQPVGDMLMLVEHGYDAAESRLDTVYTFVRNGRTETRRAAHWIYTVSEIRRIFGRHGLETLALYGDLDETPFAVGDHQLFLVMEKR
jgi:SAM-dependent methyltransferase